MLNISRVILLLSCFSMNIHASSSSAITQTPLDVLLVDSLDFFQVHQDLERLGFSFKKESSNKQSEPQKFTYERFFSKIVRGRSDFLIKNLFAYYCMSQYNLHWYSPEYDRQVVQIFQRIYGLKTEEDIDELRLFFKYPFPHLSLRHAFFPSSSLPFFLKNKFFPAQGQLDPQLWYMLSEENWDVLKHEFMRFLQTGIRENRTVQDTSREKSWDTILPARFSAQSLFSDFSYFSDSTSFPFGFFHELKKTRNYLLLMAYLSERPELSEYGEQQFIQLIVRKLKGLRNNIKKNDLTVFNDLDSIMTDMFTYSDLGKSLSTINKILEDPLLLNVQEKEFLKKMQSLYLANRFAETFDTGDVDVDYARNKDDFLFQSYQKWNRLFEDINYSLRVTEKGEFLLPKSEVEAIESHVARIPPRRRGGRRSKSDPVQEDSPK